jgi:hypothetical protein
MKRTVNKLLTALAGRAGTAMNRSFRKWVGAAFLSLIGATASAQVGPGNLGPISPPGLSVSYGNSFTSIPSTLPGIGPLPAIQYNFLDAYGFSVAPAGSFSSITASISINLGGPNPSPSFGITNIQARLAQVSPSAATILQAWSAPVNAAPGVTSETVVLAPAFNLGAGSYELQIRGVVVGTSGGSYGGSLNITPVPEPEGMAMMLAGLGLIAGIVRRRGRKG